MNEPEVWDRDDERMVRPVDPHRFCTHDPSATCTAGRPLTPEERAERIRTLRALVSRRRTPSTGQA